jgi:hypothetical protein
MRSWPALLLAPLTALAQQSICLALTRHACEQQTTLAVHVTCGVSLALIVAMSLLAASDWRSTGAPAAERVESTPARVPHFLATAGTLVGLLSALVALAMWMPVWVLGPCMA